ncbi:MAG: hypothetical protein J5707_03295 [Candidatus Methanomethylophilus sp.]|nr:hypothetical protein [Methanomethylophilus sp.]
MFLDLIKEFRLRNYENVMDGITQIVIDKHIVSSCMIRLCVSAQACFWYIFGEVPIPSILNDLKMTYEMLNAPKSYEDYLKDVLSFAYEYDDPARIAGFAHALAVFTDDDH